MPNWCDNKMTIRHSDEGKIQALHKAIKEDRFFDYIVPVPKELVETESASYGKNDPRQIELEKRQSEMKEKYGYPTWYEYCCDKWGTKWEADEMTIEEVGTHKIKIWFVSAWSPPREIFEKMIEEGYEIDAMYHESGMGFVGRRTNEEDEYYDYTYHSSTDVRDFIGETLDDVFGIADRMAEIEEENVEEDAEEDVEITEEQKLFITEMIEKIKMLANN
jgi:hypothetical protein